MSIHVRCECGKELNLKDECAGKKGRCPACGQILTIPAAQTAEPPRQTVAPTPAAAPARKAVASSASAPAALQSRRPQTLTVPVRAAGISVPYRPAPLRQRKSDRLYLLLLLALAPLVIHTFGDSDDVERRMDQTAQDHPRVFDRLEEGASLDEVLNALPDHRIQDASFARNTKVHWLFAALSAAAFFALAMLALRGKDSLPRPMLTIGLFTGTLGILLLLAFQHVADWTQGVWIRGNGVVTLLFYLVKFIGFSYRAADDPSNGFVLSFLGFTCGVGFCEELCKALPLLWHFRSKGTLTWRGACVWGLVSGVGFGVAEGIMYSSRYYNGIHTGGIYWVRFIACVGLHATWAAAVGVSLFRNQLRVQGQKTIWELLGWTAYIMALPMLLHGIYDTLLKQDHPALALLAALASFGWLAFQIERAIRQEPAEAPAPALA